MRNDARKETEKAADLWIAPKGDDGNPGTKERPFASLARGRDAARALLASGQRKSVSVVVRGGTYALTEPVLFGPLDSSVTYVASPGETPIISGGMAVSGWTKGNGELWTASIPAVREGRFYPRTLFVDGKSAIRARTPGIDDSAAYMRLADARLSKDLSTFTLKLPEGLVRTWSNIDDVEAVVLGSWEITRKRLQGVDVGAREVTLRPPHVMGHSSARPVAGMACHFENAPEMLDRPGEWYLDRKTGILSYWPLPGQDMRRLEAIVPVLTELVRVVGTREHPVRDLHFRGLAFAHADWPLPEQGYTGVQACFYYPAEPAGEIEDDKLDTPRISSAMEWEYAEECSLTHCTIAHTEGTALTLRKGCSRNKLVGNHIHDIGANGLMIGENLSHVYARNEKVPAHEVPVGNTASNNSIHAIGVRYFGAVGVGLAFTDGTIVSHNEICDIPYTGISVGYIWNGTPTVCRNNIIEYNHIHDVMTILDDGGGIYTLGLQPGTVLRGNVIHDVRRSEYTFAPSPNNGIFMDQASEGFLVEDNVIYHTVEDVLRFNLCGGHMHKWRNNTFCFSPDDPGFPREAAERAGLEPEFRKR
jgi:hypothetical protein